MAATWASHSGTLSVWLDSECVCVDVGMHAETAKTQILRSKRARARATGCAVLAQEKRMNLSIKESAESTPEFTPERQFTILLMHFYQYFSTHDEKLWTLNLI